jgi:hypothetical protein
MTEQVERNVIEKKYDELYGGNLAIVQHAQELEVVDDVGYSLAASLGLRVSNRIKLIQNEFEPSRTAAHKAHKAITELERKLLDPLKVVKAEMSKKAGAYNAAKLRAAREVEEKRLAEARKLAEQAALEQAVELEDLGDEEGAEMVIENVQTPPPMPVEAAPKVAGIKHKERWKHRVVDAAKIPRDFLIVDEKKLRQYALAMKDAAKVEGVEFFKESSTDFSGGF